MDAAFAAKSVAYTGTAGVTGTWPNGPQGILVWSDQACYVRVGVGVTATSADTPIPPFTPIAFRAPQGMDTGPWRVSAVQVSTGGTVFAKPINIR
jgi:hypothetical protein